MRCRSDLLLVLGFCAALLAPALAWRLDPGAWVALEQENRHPAPFPELPNQIGSVRDFPPAFEAWQADTLGLRTRRSESCSPGSESLRAQTCLFERPDAAGERVLLGHDSFGPWVREPLAELCASLRTLWDDDPEPERILDEAPRVVIELRSERRLLVPPEWLEDSLESLAPEAFAALRALPPRAPGPDSLGGIAPYLGSQIELDSRSGGVRLSSPDGTARVLLEGWELPPGRRLALHLVLRAPRATRAVLRYETQADPRYHRRRHVELPLTQGTNEFFVRLPEAWIVGPLLLQPGELAGEYLIERPEARSSR